MPIPTTAGRKARAAAADRVLQRHRAGDLQHGGHGHLRAPPASWRATWAAPRLILACWAVGALFAFAGALSYSELGINFPSSGGEYVYLTHAFGPEWGFMTGWVSFFAGFSAPIAAAALAFSDYLGYFFPA